MKMYGKRRTRREIAEIEGTLIDKAIRASNEQGESQDTMERRAIHGDISKMIKEGKGKIEILAYLSNTYKNTKLSIYFEQWYEYHRNKIEIGKAKENEGR